MGCSYSDNVSATGAAVPFNVGHGKIKWVKIVVVLKHFFNFVQE